MGKAEGIIEKYLVRQAKFHGFLCYKFISPSNSGVPDRILIGNGHTIFVETKSKTGKLSELQKEIIKEMKKQGATVYVPYTKKQVDSIIQSIL